MDRRRFSVCRRSCQSGPVAWGHLVNATASGGGELTKSAGGSAFNALAYSDQTFTANGSVSFVLTDNSGGVIGITGTGTPSTGTIAEIAFGFGMPNTGTHEVLVYEGGVNIGQSQQNNGTTDRFTIVVSGSVVTYQKNGVTYYTSLASASGLTLKPCADPYGQMQAVVSATISI